MSTPKGYPSQDKDDRLSAQFTTIEAVRDKQQALSVLSHQHLLSIATDAVEAGSTTSVIVATGHLARKGDVVQFTSGALSGKEVKVDSVATNAITLAETLSVSPSAADTFEILRHKYPRVNASGATITTATITPAPIQFVRDGVDTDVEEDTVTPANNRPLPVKLTGFTGDISITAQQLDVALSHTGASPDSVRIGNGTNLMGVNASLEALVSDADTHTALTTIDAKLSPLGQNTMSASMPVVIASDQTDVPVSVAALPLPSGAATEATLLSIDGKTLAAGQALMAASSPVVIASNQSTINVSDATAQASLSSIDTKTLAAGQALMAASSPVVIASDQSTLPVSAAALPLPSGAATEVTLAAIDAKLNSLGQKAMAASVPVVIASDQSTLPVSQVALSVVDLLDTPLLVASSTNIPGSASNPLQVVASLAAAVKKVQVLDTTGFFFGIYTGAALSEVLVAVVGPGSDQTLDLSIPAATRISLRAMEAAAITSGNVAINFVG